MKTFNFSGVIGRDITPDDVRLFLRDADGDEVKFLISSPGGFVSYGLEIFNMVRNYPGHVTAVLSGYAMSMASYIPLAADKIVVEDNTVYMLHNVHGGVFGDHNYILKYGRETEALSKLLAMAYVRRTGKELTDIQQLMDEESYFYGSDIVDAGFADELVETENEDTKENYITAARTAYRACSQQLAQDTAAAAEDLIKATALAAVDKDFVATKNNRAQLKKPTTQTKEQNMDLQTLKKDHHDLVVALSGEIMSGLNLETLKTGNLALVTDIMSAGAKAEGERIEGVRDQLVPGHEALIAKMEMDGESTAADAALAIVAAEKSLRKNAAADLDDGSNKIVPPVNPDANQKREMTRADYDNLSYADQRAFLADGGVLKDE